MNFVDKENETMYIKISDDEYICINAIDIYYQYYYLHPLNKKALKIFNLFSDQYIVAPDGLPVAINKHLIFDYLKTITNGDSIKINYLIKAVDTIFKYLVMKDVNKKRDEITDQLNKKQTTGGVLRWH